MSKKLEIRVNSLREAGKDFIHAWHLAEKNDKNLKSREILTFDNLQSLLKVLTPKRLELLTRLHGEGPTSVRRLASLLKRDYHNTYTDVSKLENYGLINKKEDKAFVPWSEVVAHLSLEACEAQSKPGTSTRKIGIHHKPIRKPHKKVS